ncbi:MAG: ABC transporter permease [Micromonosporaceae bacterium]
MTAVAGLPGMVGNETRKGLLVMWSHKATLAPQLGMMAATYLAIQFFIGGGRIVDALLPQTLIAYLAYVVGYIALMRMAAGVLEEMNTGTFEQSLLSPLRPWVLSVGRLGAALAEGLLIGLAVTVVFVPLLDIGIAWRWQALIPIALTLADIAGFALLIGGLAITVNSIGAIIHVISGVVMLLNGGMVPVSAYPVWLEVLARCVPTTLGMDATRRILFFDQTLGDVWADGTLAWAVLHASVMLLTGWAVYAGNVARGLRDGRLGP